MDRGRKAAGQLVAWVVVRRDDEEMIGSIAFSTISILDSCLGNGWTWLSPAARGGYANAEVKLLQLSWAFETVGAVRVAFKPDSRVAESKAALAGRDRTDLEDALPLDAPIGPSRPFFIVADDWGPLRAALAARLGATGCHS